MRNISFMLTTRQVRDRTKDVTRRRGWRNLKAGDRLQACEKCQGRRNGKPLVKLCVIEVVNVRREPLLTLLRDPAYGVAECRREGFPEMAPREFVDMFCGSHKGCLPESDVSRIEFRYVDE